MYIYVPFFYCPSFDKQTNKEEEQERRSIAKIKTKTDEFFSYLDHRISVTY